MSNQIKTFVTQLVDWYATRRIDGRLSLHQDQIPETDLDNLCALMLSQDDMLSAEAIGPDNPDFYKAIVPAVFKSLMVPKNGFVNEEFRDVMCSSIRSYLFPHIEKLIDDQLEFVNEDTACHTSLIWDRASEKTIEIRSHG